MGPAGRDDELKVVLIATCREPWPSSAVPGYQVPFGNLLQKRAQNLRPATSQRVPLFLACQSTVAMVFAYPIKEGVQSRLPKSGPIWIPDCLFLRDTASCDQDLDRVLRFHSSHGSSFALVPRHPCVRAGFLRQGS